MKKALVSILTLFGLLTTALLIGGGAAQATVPPSNCVNGTYALANAVICQIDIDQNGILNNNDIKVVVPIYVLNGSDLNVLANNLDNLTVNAPVTYNNLTVQDLVDIKNTVVNVYSLIPIVILPAVVLPLPCGCP